MCSRLLFRFSVALSFAALSSLHANSVVAQNRTGDDTQKLDATEVIADSGSDVMSKPVESLRGMDAPSRILNQYIVVLKDSSVEDYLRNKRAANMDEAIALLGQDLTWEHGGRVEMHYSHALRGFAVSGLSDIEAKRMSEEHDVAYVEADQLVELFQTQIPAIWGLDRIDQRNLPLNNSYSYTGNGAGINVYVIDSGISANNEFGSRLHVAAGYTAINDGYGTSDCNGHGTHVAGTIGGSTYGVAKGVGLYPVRVFGCDVTSTPTSVIIAGINWVYSNRINPAIANMSLGSSVNSSLDQATTNLINSGVIVVAAAGNGSANACNVSPARVAAVITVGGTTSADQMYSLSNFGGCVDVYAPAENIQSAGNSGANSVASKSGTSMAAPHVSGLAALMKATNPSASPATISQQIRDAGTTRKIVSMSAPTFCTAANRLLYSGQASPSGSPAAPSNLQTEKTCHGQYWLEWTGAASATNYEIYKTESVQPGCESHLSTTSGTGRTVSAGTVGGTTAFRVRACNSVGCSAYSLPKTISYYTGCL